MKRTIWSVALLAAIGTPVLGSDKPAPPPTPPPAPPTRNDTPPAGPTAEAEKAFSDTLTNATLRGHFTVDGNDSPPREEQYGITSVRKTVGDIWIFNAQLRHGGKDVKLPLPLPVKWAGDTPVITLTDFTLPGLGTYTARVVIYKDRYAGTWSAGDHGGELFGRIERADTAAPAAEKQTAPQPSDRKSEKE